LSGLQNQPRRSIGAAVWIGGTQSDPVLLAEDPAERSITNADDAVANTPKGVARTVYDGNGAGAYAFEMKTVSRLGSGRKCHEGSDGHDGRKGQTLGH
jgi:hypothetical protein